EEDHRWPLVSEPEVRTLAGGALRFGKLVELLPGPRADAARWISLTECRLAELDHRESRRLIEDARHRHLKQALDRPHRRPAVAEPQVRTPPRLTQPFRCALQASAPGDQLGGDSAVAGGALEGEDRGRAGACEQRTVPQLLVELGVGLTRSAAGALPS